jgi:hypothetical protein
MACCAFAVFLAMQLLIPFRWVTGLLSGKSDAGLTAPNAAVNWSPYSQSPNRDGTVIVPRAFTLPQIKLTTQFAWIVILEVSLGAAALGGVAYLWPVNVSAYAPATELALLDPLHDFICGRDDPLTRIEIP